MVQLRTAFLGSDKPFFDIEMDVLYRQGEILTLCENKNKKMINVLKKKKDKVFRISELIGVKAFQFLTTANFRSMLFHKAVCVIL